MNYWIKMHEDEGLYVVDLCQYEGGRRGIEPRKPHEPKHPKAALTTRPYPGTFLKKALFVGHDIGKVLLEDGQQFTMDPHNVWTTYEEQAYLRTGWHTLEKPGPPWINGIPPVFPPA